MPYPPSIAPLTDAVCKTHNALAPRTSALFPQHDTAAHTQKTQKPHGSCALVWGIVGLSLVLGCQAPTHPPVSPSHTHNTSTARPTPSATTQPTPSATTQPTTQAAISKLPFLSPPPEQPATDHKQHCQQVVHKYTRCMQAAYRLAQAQQSSLPPHEAARSRILLKQLKAALDHPKRETHLLQTCSRKAPHIGWLRCILRSPCDQLNRCRKTHIPRTY